MAGPLPNQTADQTRSACVLFAPVGLEGVLEVPANAAGIVLFAHGSGSGRFSPRNNYVADALRKSGVGTFLFDLLTEAEAADRANVFDIDLLADRLVEATEWLEGRDEAKGMPVGYFGASTGAAAALVAAARTKRDIAAIVSRGGRPDLAGPSLAQVRAPTLLIVGGLDVVVVELNQEAFKALTCEKALEVVPGATHLFEEPGTLDAVIDRASPWFVEHFKKVEQR
jgi:putative phosphoribosyl transferase